MYVDTRTTFRAAAAATALLISTGTVYALAATPASAAACASPQWQAQFFANTTFSGTPAATVCDAAISENYGTGDPAGVTLPNDNFGVRWSLTRDFGSGGPFALTAEALDGIRVYVDGVRQIDLWQDVTTVQKKTVNVTIPRGTHTLRVDYAAFTGSASVNFTYAPRTTPDVDTIAPLAPTGTSTTYDTTTRRATVTWSRNAEMDLAGYRVFRRLKGTSTYINVTGATYITGTTYIGVPPATGEVWYYEVRAVDKAGREGPGSIDMPVTTVDATPPAAPTGLAGRPEAGGTNSLTWQAVADAAKYEVYRAAGDSRDYTKIATVEAVGTPAYTDATLDPAVTSYKYTVKAVDAAGNASPYATHIAIAAPDTTPPLPPTALAITVEDDKGVTLAWQSGAAADTKAYNVYRAPEDLDVETKVGTTEGLTLQDTTGQAGQRFRYRVAAVDAAGNESAKSEWVFGKRAVGPESVPTAPQELTGTLTGGRLNLNWTAGPYVPVTEYRVYKSATSPVPTETGAEPYRVTQTPTLTVDDIPVDERDHFYAVVAVTQYGVASPASGSFKPVYQAHQPPAATRIYDVSGHDGMVWFVWDHVEADEGAPAITGYRVYRATEPGVTKENATALPVTTDNEFRDTEVANGTTYYYAVAAVDAAGGEAPLSAEVSATPWADTTR
ncbi:PA14 domain-containing protein [Streptomyces sp. ISL-100]|uniref:fibronectin type III domain-containing protein n=1 Tax=Streptomyces sp. ISL-100 TaxID=2819173 RepID=UPI001BE6E05E|nr:PA14 domain-containing protein [Streptomyces sp. ISL-100]MBT2401304.1 cellulose 1,4-beta-cellobiosidase [Streptomyces sp. ISL-100]